MQPTLIAEFAGASVGAAVGAPAVGAEVGEHDIAEVVPGLAPQSPQGGVFGRKPLGALR